MRSFDLTRVLVLPQMGGRAALSISPGPSADDRQVHPDLADQHLGGDGAAFAGDQLYQPVLAHRLEGARQVACLPAGQYRQFRKRRWVPLVDDPKQPAVWFGQHLRQRLKGSEPDFRLVGPAMALPACDLQGTFAERV